jgi:GTPase SAR1 family protein
VRILQKEDLFEILENHLFSNSYLDEKRLSAKIQISQKEIKEFFSRESEEMGFIKEGSSVYFAHEIIRENIENIKESFWMWFLRCVPSYSDVAWEEGSAVADTSKIKIIPSRASKKSMIQTFTARILILGEERTGKQSYVYALSGDTLNRPAPGVFSGKISRSLDEFETDFESIILDLPPGSPLWIYAKASFGVILAYDLSEPITFEKLLYWLELFSDSYSYELCPPIMLLGTKSDLVSREELQIFKKEADFLREQIEQEYGTIVLSEMVSLTDGGNVLKSFENFAKTIRQWYQIIKQEYQDDNPMV